MEQKKNGSEIRIRRAGLLFYMVFLLLLLSLASVQAEETKTQNQPLKKVRVGYLIYQGYQEGEGEEPKSGYGYEYLPDRAL